MFCVPIQVRMCHSLVTIIYYFYFFSIFLWSQWWICCVCDETIYLHMIFFCSVFTVFFFFLSFRLQFVLSFASRVPVLSKYFIHSFIQKKKHFVSLIRNCDYASVCQNVHAFELRVFRYMWFRFVPTFGDNTTSLSIFTIPSLKSQYANNLKFTSPFFFLFFFFSLLSFCHVISSKSEKK